MFSSTPPTVALRRADLDIGDGEFVAIRGTSGAGKSTMLNILGLLDVPTSGTYRIAGHDTAGLSDTRRGRLRADTFGFVFQAAHVLPYDSVEHNAAMGLLIRGMSRPERERRVAEVLERVGLSHRIGHRARELSGGERQRLAIARALAPQPRVLIADEPTGNLDSATTETILELFRTLHRSGVTIVMSTHDAHVARAAQRTVTVIDGTVAATLDTGAAEPAGERRWRAQPAARLVDALGALCTRPVRSLLLASAFVLGAGGLVAATGIGATAATQVADRLTASSLDSLSVFANAGTSQEEREARRAALTRIDHVRTVGEQIPIEAQDAAVSTAGDATPGAESFHGPAFGANSDFLQTLEAATVPAAATTLLDDSDAGNVAIIGSDAAAQLGIPENAQGRRVSVSGTAFTVVGIISSTGRDPSLDSAVIIPLRAVSERAITYSVRCDPGYPAALAEAIPVALAPANPGSVSVSTAVDLRALRIGVSEDLGMLVAGTAGVLLVMAVLGASATMFVSVQSRAGEIALRRALGLSRRGAALMFLWEGTLLGAAGGTLGVAVGTGAVVLLSLAREWTAVLPPGSAAVGILVGTVAGALSALVPAIAAARVQPAQAIQ